MLQCAALDDLVFLHAATAKHTPKHKRKMPDTFCFGALLRFDSSRSLLLHGRHPVQKDVLNVVERDTTSCCELEEDVWKSGLRLFESFDGHLRTQAWAKHSICRRSRYQRNWNSSRLCHAYSVVRELKNN